LIKCNIDKWIDFGASCTNCKTGIFIEKMNVTQTSNICILALKLFQWKNDDVNKITNVSIKSVPTIKFQIENEQFRVISAIFHVGSSAENGHYTCMVRTENTKWIDIGDLRVQEMNAPRNSKNAYAFILEKINK
jgi:uncharacterized UBP type Zn finger protein